jgi:AraC-like DNA-binding protein
MISSDFVASYFDAWNHHDAGAVADHLARGGTYCDMPFQRQLARAELIAHLTEYFAQDNCRYQLIGEILRAENSIAFQYRACPQDRSDETAGWTGAEFVTMQGDAAGRIEDYYRSPDLESAVRAATPDSVRQRIQRYAKSGLDEEGLQAVMTRLTELMEAERFYLEPDLSLPQLSERMDCSVNHLSQAINAGFGVSFYDYVNGYRVRQAADILCSDDRESNAILEVALAVGFNSTSTFYAAFKKITGQTPAQYRRETRVDSAD